MNFTCDIPDESNGNCAIPGDREEEEHGGDDGPSVPETQLKSQISARNTVSHTRGQESYGGV